MFILIILADLGGVCIQEFNSVLHHLEKAALTKDNLDKQLRGNTESA